MEYDYRASGPYYLILLIPSFLPDNREYTEHANLVITISLLVRSNQFQSERVS